MFIHVNGTVGKWILVCPASAGMPDHGGRDSEAIPVIASGLGVSAVSGRTCAKVPVPALFRRRLRERVVGGRVRGTARLGITVRVARALSHRGDCRPGCGLCRPVVSALEVLGGFGLVGVFEEVADVGGEDVF